MNICLDTCAYIALKKGNQETIDLMETVDMIFIPTIVLGELYYGFYTGTKTSQNIKELEDFLEINGIEIIPVTKEIAERYGILVTYLRKKGTPLPTNDIWIAATVFETGSRLLTYDKHFHAIEGLVMYSP